MMTTTVFRPLLAALAMPLALALTACGGGDEAAAPAGEPVAAVPAPEGQNWTDVVAETPEGGYLVGNPDAPIRLLEYGSHTCPACAAFSNDAMQPLLQDYVDSGRVSYEFRSVVIHGAIDLLLTRLIQCGPKEAAIPLSEQIWGNLNAVLDPLEANMASVQQAMSLPEDQRLVAYAERGKLLDFFAARGMSTDQAKQCLADFPAVQALASQMESQTDKDGVNSTPTFFLNGRRLDGTSWRDVEPALQRAGAR